MSYIPHFKLSFLFQINNKSFSNKILMTWLYIYFLCTDAFYLFNEGVKRFLGRNSADLMAEMAFNPEDMTVNSFNYNTLRFILSIDGASTVLDRSGGKGQLINWSYHGGSNQQFRIFLAANDQFMIEQQDQCVFYDEHNKKFAFRPCNGYYNTFFSIFYELRILNVPNCVDQFMNQAGFATNTDQFPDQIYNDDFDNYDTDYLSHTDRDSMEESSDEPKASYNRYKDKPYENYKLESDSDLSESCSEDNEKPIYC